MSSYYKRLKADLASAAADGVITPQQAERLYERTYSTRLFASFRAAHWISILAGLFIAAGLSLIIAHNWDKIGAAAKMLAYLLIFAGTAEAVIRLETKPFVSIPAEILWFFMPAIGIGLYAQIFQLSGDLLKPYLLWLALSLPLAFFSGRKAPAMLAVLLAFAALYYGSFSDGNMLSLVGTYHSPKPPLIRWLWPAALMGAAFAVYFFKIKTGGIYRPTGLALVWLLIAFLAPTALQLKSMVFIMLAVISLAVIWLVLSQDEETMPRLPALAWTAVVYAMTFFWHFRENEMTWRDDTLAGIITVWIVFAAALILAVTRPFKRFSCEGRWQAGVKAGLVISMVSVFLLFDAGRTGVRIIAALANALLIALGLAQIFSGSEKSEEKEINSGVALIFLIIVTRFLDIFGNLLKSGLAFIAAGLAFACLAYMVNKGRKAIIDAAKKS